MALETSNTPAAARTKSTLRRRIDDVEDGSRRNSKRWKRVQDDDDDEYAAASCLLSLARCGGAVTTTAGSLDAERNSYYRCGVCSKTFPSYQALGGHKTSHRNKPPTAAVALSFSGTAEASSCAAAPNPYPISRLHKCTICHKNFPTGQALGGHKRKHYVGGRNGGGARSSGANCSEDGSGASGVTSTDRGAVVSHSQGGGADVMAFDLNLPPPPELDLTLNFM